MEASTPFSFRLYAGSRELPTASPGEDLPLSIGMPTGGTEMDRGMGNAIDECHPLFDDHSTIRTGAGRD